MATYLLGKSSHLRVKKSQLENCSNNCSSIGVHQMRQRYYICKCSVELACPLTFKINSCQKSKNIEVFQEKDKEVECISYNDTIEPKKPPRGLVSNVQELIEELCRADADETPKRILVKLMKIRKEKNLFDKKLIPTLTQVN